MSKLLNCPFCGSDMSDEEKAHDAECYFTLHRALINAPKGDLSGVPDVLEAWNRRATPPSPSTASEADEQADFEAWHRSKFATKHSTGQPTRDMHNGIYAENYGPKDQQMMWEVWQARAALASKPPAREAKQSIDTDEFSSLIGDLLQAFSRTNNGEDDSVYLIARRALIAYIDGRTAGAAPGTQLNCEDDLVAWLDTLYECDGNGTIYNRKWEPAQRAIKGVRAIEAKAVSSMDRAELQIEVFKLRAAINATELEGGYKLVPLEATEAMVHAAQDLPPPRMFGVVYRAMIAAAPAPTNTGTEEDK